VVSGVLTSAPGSSAGRILDAMLSGSFPFLLSIALLAEYREVLLRPRIQRRHGLTEEELDVILTQITSNGIVREAPPVPERAPDPKDNHLWELLATHPGAVLVTADRLLHQRPPSFGAVLPVRTFAEMLPG
jgi:predicted nucleic acid-binding protein